MITRCFAYDCREGWTESSPAVVVPACRVHFAMLPMNRKLDLLLCAQASPELWTDLDTYEAIARARRYVEWLEARHPTIRWTGAEAAFAAGCPRRRRGNGSVGAAVPSLLTR